MSFIQLKWTQHFSFRTLLKIAGSSCRYSMARFLLARKLQERSLLLPHPSRNFMLDKDSGVVISFLFVFFYLSSKNVQLAQSTFTRGKNCGYCIYFECVYCLAE
ncbi:hypothetical protein GOODEAATRI_031884 [Goodea atripinnis]|uniref:Uncharacterized protein n=1 Tax=Goodea atripinnis TaxID=208336 RepID=A0ABV0Q3H7_9TELE